MRRRIQSLDVRTHTLNIVIYLRGLDVRAVLPLRACIQHRLVVRGSGDTAGPAAKDTEGLLCPAALVIKTQY